MSAYAETVEQYFSRPPGDYAGEFTGEAGSVAAGTWIGVCASAVSGNLTDLGFRAFACPHIIAACRWLCEQLDGQPVEALAQLDREALREKFDMPVEKAGKLLILQDALEDLLAGMQAQAGTDRE